MLTISQIRKIEAWAVQHAQEYLDSTGGVCLTSLEEAVLFEFDLEDEDFEEADLSFRIFNKVESLGLLSD